MDSYVCSECAGLGEVRSYVSESHCYSSEDAIITSVVMTELGPCQKCLGVGLYPNTRIVARQECNKRLRKDLDKALALICKR